MYLYSGESERNAIFLINDSLSCMIISYPHVIFKGKIGVEIYGVGCIDKVAFNYFHYYYTCMLA